MYGDCLHAILTSYATYQSGYFGVLYIRLFWRPTYIHGILLAGG